MRRASDTAEIRGLLRSQDSPAPLALVPTMGNLHAGHIRLVKKAGALGYRVVVSIFVNPLQFSRGEDLEAYPRTLEEDMQQLEEAGCHFLFTPSVATIYPEGIEHHTVIHVPEVSTGHCGASRPGHFDGVATVVGKLFQIIQPHSALFGLKDYQQYLVIRKMVADLCMPIQIMGVETVREESGLALSSRNSYLSPEEREQAPGLYATLLEAEDRIRQGRDFQLIEEESLKKLQQRGFRPDYFNISHAVTLAPAMPADTELVILAAAYLGNTRLIDNLRVSL